ncbi:hypothetical protein HF828_001660, partial [Campylobacter lari]|nr:hypothetical protein [Campylobacter lari]
AKLVIKLEDELSTISQKDTDSISKIKNELRLCGMKEDPKNGILNFKPIDENFIRSFVNVIKKYQKNNFFNFRSSNQFEDENYVKREEELISKLFELALKNIKNKNKISGEDNE